MDITNAMVSFIKNKKGEISDDGRFLTIVLRYYDNSEYKETTTDLSTIISISNTIFLNRNGEYNFSSAKKLLETIEMIPGLKIDIEGEIKEEVVHATRCTLSNMSV